MTKRSLPFVPHGDPPDPRWTELVILPTDYSDYGGDVVRWSDPALAYPDCSCGCAWFDAEDADWGVCMKPGAPRDHLLTWEHQAGFGCYEHIEALAERAGTAATASAATERGVA